MSNTILITGANGEVGHSLIRKLKADESTIIALDITDLDNDLLPLVSASIKMSITNKEEIHRIILEHNPSIVFHLAARLSSLAEKDPILAHDVNVNGTAYLLDAATNAALQNGNSIKFIYPSTIAVYGMASLEEKNNNSKVSEDYFLNPITMYGVNKLYGEYLGKYYSLNYKLTSNVETDNLIDFRALRFPGLISADTLPSGGTSDYASEMVHSAAQNIPYNCFVREDSTIPFMAMPDAVSALIKLSMVEKTKLTRQVYNVSGFSLSANELYLKTRQFYKEAQISFNIDSTRQKIVDSWPKDCDDSKARSDWGYSPLFTSETIFSDYLVPAINRKYSN